MPLFGAFNRPVGAAVDVRELEYISALHQTDLPRLRRDGTIKAIDILILLRSRFGLVVELDQALDILMALGGDCVDGKIDTDKLDVAAIEIRDHERDMHKDEDALNATLESYVRRRNEEQEHAVKDSAGKDPKQMGSTKPTELKGFKRRKDKGKGGDDAVASAAAEEEVCLDLVQLLSIIIMPTLARSGKEWIDRNIHGIDPAHMPVDETINASKWTMSYLVEKHRIKRKKQDAERIQSLRPKPENLIEDVHKMMMAAIEDDEYDRAEAARVGGGDFVSSLAQDTAQQLPVLNEKFVRRLLECCGEYERAAEPELIAEMVCMATGTGDAGSDSCTESTDEPVLFNVEALVRALTSDMEAWQVGCEDKFSTVWADVMGFESLKEYEEVRLVKSKESGKKAGNRTPVDDHDSSNSRDDLSPQESKDLERGQLRSGGSNNAKASVEVVTFQEEGNNEIDTPASLDVHAIRREPTATHIDYVADISRSVPYTVFLWVFYVTTALCYMTLFQATPIVQGNCRGSEFGCTLAGTIWSWLMLAIGLVLAGYLIMTPISLGNSAILRSNKVAAFCFVWTAIVAAIPYTLVFLWREDIEPPSENAQLVGSSWWFLVFMRITLVMGILLSLILAVQIPLNSMTAIKRNREGKLQRWMMPQNIKSGAYIKMAGSRKVNSFLTNAHALHPVGTAAERSILIGGKKQTQSERTMSNYVLFGEREVRSGGFLWTWKRMLDRSLLHTEGIWLHSRLFVGQAAQIIISIFALGLFYAGTPILAAQSQAARDELIEVFGDELPQWIYDFIPTEQQVRYAFYPAAGVATAVALVIVCLYLPSTVSTILKFRCGRIPSLHGSSFVKYRMASDTIYLNVANMIYSLLGSLFLFFVLIALFIFLIMWPVTWPFMKLMFAWLLGLVITILLKTIAIKLCRANFYQAFYRRRPAAANFANLALECWYIGLGGGVLVARFSQFILASVFWIGRIDVPYLSPDVNIAGYGFDLVPTNYRKDLLVHDAHRHPLIERISAMYLMRLVHGQTFSSRAGACWRNVFVVVLCPWMTKHRVFKTKADKLLEKSLLKSGGSKVGDDSAYAKTFGDQVVDSAWNRLNRMRGVREVKDGAVTAATQIVEDWPSKYKKEEEQKKKKTGDAEN